MSLIGVYENKEAKSELTIKTANDTTGQLSGELKTTYEGTSVTIPVTGHYHFWSSTGPLTSIAFFALYDNPPNPIYEAWAGAGTAQAFPTLEMKGTRSVLVNGKTIQITHLPGNFVRKS